MIEAELTWVFQMQERDMLPLRRAPPEERPVLRQNSCGTQKFHPAPI